MVRAPVCGTGGCGFESRHPPQPLSQLTLDAKVIAAEVPGDQGTEVAHIVGRGTPCLLLRSAFWWQSPWPLRCLCRICSRKSARERSAWGRASRMEQASRIRGDEGIRRRDIQTRRPIRTNLARAGKNQSPVVSLRSANRLLAETAACYAAAGAIASRPLMLCTSRACAA